MKRAWMLGLMVSLVIGLSGVANAALTVIGTASYDSDGNGTPEDYNLIYMDDGPFGPITWLDYTRGDTNWQNQVNWASGLGADLEVTLNGYTSTIDWSTGWRLPETDESQANLSGGFGYEGPDATGYHDYLYGDNMVNSEMGHLYYEALGNKGHRATDGTRPQPGWGLLNTGDFDNLLADYYWSGTEYSPNPDYAWRFYFHHGYQNRDDKSRYDGGCALAVRPGDVSAVPIPSAILLLGSGLIGLAGIRRKLNKA